MNVLVTGGAGYVGSVVTRHLLEVGHAVRVLDNLSFGGRSLLGVWSHPRFRFVKGDLRDPEAVGAALAGVEAVVHLAAIVGDPACARQPELAREVNLEASLALFDAARRRGVAYFLFASTCSNYGRMADPDGLVNEEAELNPVSLYAETKVAVEEALMAGAEEGPAPTILRFATVFGISPRMRFDLTVNEFTKELLTKGRLAVYGQQFWRPYVHVRDAARAVALALETAPKAQGFRVFNVGDTDQNYRKGDLVDLIRRELDRPVEIEYVHRQEDPRDYRVSFEKARSELGFSITRTVPQGIREVKEALESGVIEDPDDPKYRN